MGTGRALQSRSGRSVPQGFSSELRHCETGFAPRWIPLALMAGWLRSIARHTSGERTRAPVIVQAQATARR